MNSEEVQMTGDESLLLISSVINKAKNGFNESGTFLYIQVTKNKPGKNGYWLLLHG